MKKKFFLSTILMVLFCLSSLSAQTVIDLSPEKGDLTLKLRNKLEQVKGKEELTINLEAGTYNFRPDYAFEKYCAITNHGNGTKRILFPIKGFKKVTINGNGAKIICHGLMFPFLFENCSDVKVNDLSINWDIPFTFLAEVMAVNEKEGYRDVKPYGKKDGYSWVVEKGKLKFPNIDGFNYTELGSTLSFNKETKRVAVGALDLHSNPTKVEQLKNGNLRIYEKLRQYPRVGEVLSSKGNRELDRYAPAFDFKECKDITLDKITIHHALGMAFLFERSENIQILNSNVVVEEGSVRVIASTADASHFANCKGDVLIENCRFENMLDDGTNVHGTYVEVHKVLGKKKVVVELKHFEQSGFKFADKGDEMWFILHPSPSRHSGTATVSKARTLNEKYIELTFNEDLPSALKAGDFIENKTWNPVFTMRGCTIRNHRARSVILKTPLKTVIENNYFSSMMSGVLFRGESYFWFESGALEDVLIQNNTFENCADCGSKHAALYITPNLSREFDQTETFDKNIRFINNTIKTSNPRVVIADRAEGLVISGNKIILTDDFEPLKKDAPAFELINCKDVTIEKNSFEGKSVINSLESDDASKKTLTIKKNKGIKF